MNAIARRLLLTRQVWGALVASVVMYLVMLSELKA
jgi:hypothetical protein